MHNPMRSAAIAILAAAVGFGVARLTVTTKSAPAQPRSDSPEASPNPDMRRLREENRTMAAEIALLRETVADLESAAAREPAGHPPTPEEERHAAFEARRKQTLARIATPLVPGDETAEKLGVEGRTAAEIGYKFGKFGSVGWFNSYAERVSDADFPEFMRATVDRRIEDVERVIGRSLTREQREGIHDAFVRHWSRFREWYRTEYREIVRNATTNEELNDALMGEYLPRKRPLFGNIRSDVHKLFRGSPQDVADREKVFQQL